MTKPNDPDTIRYAATLAGISTDQLTGFFEGWPNPPTPGTLHRILNGSYAFVLAVNTAGEVVGFVNAISDGVLTAYIPLLEVQPGWRGHGIATRLVRELVAHLDGLYMIDTSCDDELVPFYERLGLRRGNAMILRNYGRQNGE